MLTEVFRADPTNPGDWHCRPGAYLPYQTATQVVDVKDVKPPTGPGAYVVGGGGLICPVFPQVEQLLRDERQQVVLWGVGHNMLLDLTRGFMRSATLDFPDWVGHAALVGVRDYGTPFEWVPCASCLHPAFDTPRAIRHDAVLFEHKRIPTGIQGLPAMRNDGDSLEEVLDFLASGEIVLTNSYHGAYWATLLGRRTIVFPFGSKFFGFKHRVPLCAPEEWSRHRREAVVYPEALAECRARNLEFHAKVLDRLHSADRPPASSVSSVSSESITATAAMSTRSIGERHCQRILSFLPPGGRMLAWGAGDSTVWFADRLPANATLVNIEHDPDSHARVAAKLGVRPNVDLRLRPPSGPLGQPDTRDEEQTLSLSAYLRAAHGERFDVIVINGLARSACLTIAQDLLAPGGVVCLHDSQRSWYDEAKRAYRGWGALGVCPDSAVRTLWFGGLQPWTSPAKAGAQLPLIVSYFTRDTPYEEEAREMIATCEQFGLDHDVVGLPAAESWEASCARKAQVCLDAWHRHGRPILWVDADARLHAPPSLLASCTADFAVHRWYDWKVASGTIFFNQTPLAQQLLERWAARCQAQPEVWDQISLDLAWEELTAQTSLDTWWLPRSYCDIFGAPADEKDWEPPVILHYQASRRLKTVVSQTPPRPRPVATIALQRARLAARPRRWLLAGPDSLDFETDVLIERRLDAVPYLPHATQTPRGDAERVLVEACLHEIEGAIQQCRDEILDARVAPLVFELQRRQPASFAIYGAGLVGQAIARVARQLGLTPVAFVESDPTRHGSRVMDLPIKSAAACRALGCDLYAIGSFASASGMIAVLDAAYRDPIARYDALVPSGPPPRLPDLRDAAATLLAAQSALASGQLLAQIRPAR